MIFNAQLIRAVTIAAHNDKGDPKTWGTHFIKSILGGVFIVGTDRLVMTVALDPTAIMAENKKTLDLSNIKILNSHTTLDLGTSESEKLIIDVEYCKWEKPITDSQSNDLIPCNTTVLRADVLKKILKTAEVFDKHQEFTLHCFSHSKTQPSTNMGILVRYTNQPDIFSLVMPVLEDEPGKAELPFIITPVA